MSPAAVDRGIAPALRRLYFVRFAFAVVWAGLVVATASTINPLSATLFVLYPLFDLAAAVVDARSSGNGKPVPGLYVNMAISLLAGVGLAIALSSGIPAVLRVWGAWAILSGLVQLVVGLTRYRLGGQWPMIISGAISAVAGTSFILQAGQPSPTLSTLAGYATLGGVFFLVSALRLGRAAKTA
ncbi:hypothetical protein [Kutzneria sp. CA-103260]|uniref:hypothetical protein n=1 Tax=Kutzneria sp. CA-103260 TaxID=2802641 RepID=UPI001BA6AC9B|nr:hypothetical protein [Kutzneria sp. CA-103260]QUQ63922.1 integral membrane protein [Kutzneria sp. CA-103260]